MKYLLALIFLLLPALAEASGTIRYAATTGSGTACTVITTPCTVNTAISQTASGDIVYIRGGTYAQSITFPTSGTSGAPTIVSRYQNETVTFTPTNGNSLTTGGSNPTYVTFDGFIVDGTASGTSFINGFSLCCDYVANITLQNSEIQNFGGNGVEGFAHSFTIRNTLIHDNGSNTTAGPPHGLYLHGNNITIENNTVYNNDHFGIHFYPAGINATIRFNTVYGNGKSPLGLRGGGDGILIAGCSSGCRVYGNLVYGTVAGDGIRAAYGTVGATIYGNTVYGNSAAGIETYSDATGTLIKNNISFGNSGSSILDAGSSTMDHNYCSSGCTGTGTINSATDPFVAKASFNFNLVSTSTAINAGATLGSPYNTDILSVVRPQGAAYDMGAYEFISSSLPTIAITSPTSAATYNTSSSTLPGTGPTNVNGVSSVIAGAGTVTWSCDRCTPATGTATGVGAWSLPTLTLKAGINILTVTATTSGGASSAATLTITYAPTYPGPTLAGAWSFDEAAGNALDSSTNGNTGTLTNGATRSANGRFGKALQLSSASSQSVIVADAISLDFTQSFTLSAWVQPNVLQSDFRAILYKNSLPLDSTYQLYATINGAGYCATSALMGLANTNGASGPRYNACRVTPLPINTWTHVALVYDGTSLKLYRSDITPGTPVTTTPVSPQAYLEPSAGSLQIGASEFGEYFDGLIDEVRVYNWALPVTAGGNTIGGACNQTASVSTPSIAGDMNCPIIPLAAPVLKFAASAPFKMGNAPMKWGTVPQ